METSDGIISNEIKLPTNSPFPEDLSENVACFSIKKHTKLTRIITRAEKDFSNESVKRIIFHGISSCEKCISFVEVFKQIFNKEPIFQWNILKKNQNANLEEIDLINPEIFIMISKDPFPDKYRCLSQQMRTCEDNAEITEFNISKGASQIKKQLGKQYVSKQNKKMNKWRRPNKCSKKNVIKKVKI